MNMKKILMAFTILMASFSVVNAGENAGNDKNIVICYLEGNRIVFEDVGRVIYYESGEVKIRLTKSVGYGDVTFSGAFACIEAENNDKLVGKMKNRFGSNLE